MRAPLLLLLIALFAYAPQLQLPDWQGTEGRRVQIAMEMARSGDFMVPTLGHEPTLAKPPLYYWVLAGVQEIAGTGRAAMRLPSVLGLWLLALVAFALLRRMFDPGAAWVGALGILLSAVLLHDGPRAEIDPLFAAFTAGAVLLLAYGVARQHRGVLLAAGAVGGLALLTKGLPLLLFLAGPLLVWLRHRRFRGWLWFVVPLLVVPLCYYLPLWLLRVPPSEFVRVASEESVGRLQFLEWGRIARIPLYLVRAVLVVMPFGLWAVYEFRGSRDARMGPEDLMLRMCSAGAIGAVVLLALFPARPTRYLLPAVPLFVAAVAPAVAHYARSARQLGPLARYGLPVAGIVGAAALAALPFLPHPLPGRTVGFCVALALLPILVHRPLHLVAACLLLPLVAAWTALPDRADHQRATGRGYSPVAAPLLRELRAFDVPDDGLQTFGHLHSAVLVEASVLPAGDELKQRAPELPWVLYEETRKLPGATPRLPGYVERVRIGLPDRTFVLAQRRDGR